MVNTPFISPDSVHVALDSLLYSTSNKEIPLLYLLLVDEFLAQPELPHSSLKREFALSHILTLLITSEFTQQRNLSGHQIPEANLNQQDLFVMIQRDAETTSYLQTFN